MQLKEIFRKRSNAALLAATLGLAGAGGYAGMELADRPAPAPQASTLTLAQHNQDSLEGRMPEEARRKEAGEDQKRASTLNQFRNAIARMEQDRREIEKLAASVVHAKARAEGVVIDTNITEVLKANEARVIVLRQALQAQADRFIDQLRLSEHISEKDYGDLVTEFDARVDVAPSEKNGNYRHGAMFQQECRIVSSFESFLSFGDMTDEEQAFEIGACMSEAPALYENKDAGVNKYAAGAGGALAGGLLSIPLWRRRKVPGPKS